MTVWILVMLVLTPPQAVQVAVYKTAAQCSAALPAARMDGVSRAWCEPGVVR